jgi:hypothetical protein
MTPGQIKRTAAERARNMGLSYAGARFGSEASAQAHVRFTPDSDRESGFPQTVMSALPPKADMCGAARDVRFGSLSAHFALQSTYPLYPRKRTFGMADITD